MVASILVFWTVSIDTIVADQSVEPHVRAVWAAYPVADAVLLALVARALLSRRPRRAVDPSFAWGVGLWLAADIAYLQAPDGAAQIAMDAAWMVAPVLLARAAWRAHQVVDEPREVEPPSSAVPQLVVAIAPLFLPPALAVVAMLRGEPGQPLALAVGATGRGHRHRHGAGRARLDLRALQPARRLVDPPLRRDRTEAGDGQAPDGADGWIDGGDERAGTREPFRRTAPRGTAKRRAARCRRSAACTAPAALT